MRERHDVGTTTASGTARVFVRSASVVVVAGPDVGATARVEQPTFVIGTGDDADLRLADPRASRAHLRLSLGESRLGVRDDSKNGTWLQGTRVRELEVVSSVTLTIGSSTLTISVDAEPRALDVAAARRFGAAIGGSTAMRHVFGLLEQAAPTEVTVLIEGESGVGKDLLAHAVHAASRRAAGPFVAIDCGAIPPTLVESELFGHERGAFTGADVARLGAFEQANGGTVFLDEVGELPLDSQPKLLRVLEQREVRPVGSRAPRTVDVRVVAATNRRLSEAVKRGEFRTDLLYRLAVARVNVPPLRDRREDIVPIADALLARAVGAPDARIPPDLAPILEAYDWPGNVRELRNAVERYALLGLRDAAGVLGVEGCPTPLSPSLLPYHEARRRALEGFDRAYADQALRAAGGVVTRAAELAQVGRASFYRMLDRARVDRDD